MIGAKLGLMIGAKLGLTIGIQGEYTTTDQRTAIIGEQPIARVKDMIGG